MVQGLDDTEGLDIDPFISIDNVEGGSRSVIKRKNNIRNVLSDKFKYRHTLNLYRFKKYNKNISQTGHCSNISKDLNQQLNNNINEYCDLKDCDIEEQEIVDLDRNVNYLNEDLDVKNLVDSLSDETDVPPLDQGDTDLSFNVSKSNPISNYIYTSNSTTNTTSNITNNALGNDILNSVSGPMIGLGSHGGGARLVKKDITKLGKLELINNIESYVQLNFSNYRQFYERVGPIRLTSPLSDGLQSNHVDISLWNDPSTQLISQNSSKRKVYNIYWLPKILSNIALRAAIKFVEDCNIRDGRSIKREIECHLYMYQRFQAISKNNNSTSLILQDDWPTVEVLGYYLDKKDPGQSILISRKLTGPDFFYIIRSENSSSFVKKITPIYEFNKLDWCITALNRIAQFGSVGIRHNDIKPDNIVLDVYFDQGVKKVDVKIIDLGAASMEFTKEFTGGTPWYESPEQKLLEYYTKKNRNNEMAHKVNIDISSDAWGAGLSIVEVLMGKRVVDYIKQPYGIGLLNFTGVPIQDNININQGETHRESTSITTTNTSRQIITQLQPEIDNDEYLWWNKDEYWEISPEVWVQEAKKVLGLTCVNCNMNKNLEQENIVNYIQTDNQNNMYEMTVIRRENKDNDRNYNYEINEMDNNTINSNYNINTNNNYGKDNNNYDVYKENKEENFDEFYLCQICNNKYNENVKENICRIVSRYVFNSLVVVDPRKRKTVQDVANQLRSFVTQAISYHL